MPTSSKRLSDVVKENEETIKLTPASKIYLRALFEKKIDKYEQVQYYVSSIRYSYLWI